MVCYVIVMGDVGEYGVDGNRIGYGGGYGG